MCSDPVLPDLVSPKLLADRSIGRGCVTATVAAMSKRNLIWLVAIVVVFVAVWLSTSFLWGLLSGAVMLVGSELVERGARKRRVAARGGDPLTPVRSSIKRKRS